MTLHRITKRWLNAKITFYEEIFARVESGEKVNDEFCRNWKARRLGRKMLPTIAEDTPTKIEVEYDKDYWARWYARRRKK